MPSNCDLFCNYYLIFLVFADSENFMAGIYKKFIVQFLKYDNNKMLNNIGVHTKVSYTGCV